MDWIWAFCIIAILDFNIPILLFPGLDPAGPKLDNAHKDVSLDNTDAEFVDVIHSDASTPLLGTLKRQGHVDFYPNGGLHQPGCKKSTVGKWSAEQKLFRL